MADYFFAAGSPNVSFPTARNKKNAWSRVASFKESEKLAPSKIFSEIKISAGQPCKEGV